MCDEFSQCYDDVNICLWTDGSLRNRSDALSKCEGRNSFLPRVTNSDIQSKLRVFRSAASPVYLPDNKKFWIDVYTTTIDKFHWIDGSSLAGQFIYEFAGRPYHSSMNILIRERTMC